MATRGRWLWLQKDFRSYRRLWGNGRLPWPLWTLCCWLLGLSCSFLVIQDILVIIAKECVVSRSDQPLIFTSHPISKHHVPRPSFIPSISNALITLWCWVEYPQFLCFTKDHQKQSDTYFILFDPNSALRVLFTISHIHTVLYSAPLLTFGLLCIFTHQKFKDRRPRTLQLAHLRSWALHFQS